jgi:hypothetical protein
MVVELLTANPEIRGSNPAAAQHKDKMKERKRFHEC